MKKSYILIVILLALILVVFAFLFFSNSSKNYSQHFYNTSNQSQIPSQSQNTTTQQMPQNVISTTSSIIGSIITDTVGKTLYIFQADANGQSTCYGNCATTWPPLIVASGVIPQGIGVTAKLDVIKRTDGTYQLTANGMPLYYYIADPKTGTLNGQGSSSYGAKWYVLSPSGQLITNPIPPSNPPIGGGGGGGGY